MSEVQLTLFQEDEQVTERPSIEYLRECFRYEDGKLFWLIRPREHFQNEGVCTQWNGRWAGKEAGNSNKRKNGDRRCAISIANGKYLRYHLIWVLHGNAWTEFIDHKNRVCDDDRIENLRPATKAQNSANSKRFSSNSTGYKGVTWHKKRRRWVAKIMVNGKTLYLGQYVDPLLAHAAYVAGAKKAFGEFASTGLEQS